MRWRIEGWICKPGMAAGETHCGSDDSLLGVSWPLTGRAVKTIENLLADFVVAGVADHMLGVGVDPN
jgi:hypothetical protein